MKKIIIGGIQSGIRIDKFLKGEIFFNAKISRGEIIRQIKEGNISVSGKKIKPSYILKVGDAIEIDLPKKSNTLLSNKNVEFKVICEDKNFIIINKPAGLQVHPGFKNEGDTLVSGLIYRFPEIKNVGDLSTSSKQANTRPGIVHRLDRDTSGVMVVARNQKTFLELKNKFKNREIEKIYWAVVRRKFKVSEKSGIIDAPLARAKNYQKQVVAGKKTRTKIRPAVTEYKVLKEAQDCSLVEIYPKTGRTHQIRVHLASIGHPVVGDIRYGRKNILRLEKVKRHLLHAKSLEFALFEKKYHFETELPADFKNFLDEKRIKS
jgi:23S rRNA pseudouridine1911/1915/1917 synthase